jgi:DNA-binding transcriptional ArsR family regulator
MSDVLQIIRRLELLTRGVAHRHRIRALFALDKGTPLTLEELSIVLETDYRNAGQHVRKMHRAGLIDKRYRGHSVLHSITEEGRRFISFYNSL